MVSLVLGATLICSLPKPAKADNPVNQVFGAISNAYGTWQAADFVASWFGIGVSHQLADAVNQLETFMQTYRDQALVNSVHADLLLFQFISSNYQSGLTNDLEANFINQCINDLSQLQGDIQNGTMADAYMLAPAYNLLTITFTGAVKAFGIMNPANAYPAATLDSYFSSAFSTDYSLVGAYFVNYDLLNFNGGNTGMLLTQGGKKMWPKYAGTYYGIVITGNPTTATGYYACDLTNPANADDIMMSYCFFQSWTPPYYPYTYVGTPPDPYLSAARSQWSTSFQNFNADQSVQTVVASIRGLMNLGHSVVADWDTGGAFPYAIGHILSPL
jgi:hypothetical protein